MRSAWIVALLTLSARGVSAATPPRTNGIPKAVLGSVETAGLQAIARAAPGAEARVQAVFSTADGGHIVRFQQLYRSLPVLRAIAAVRLDASGRVLRVTDGFAPLSGLRLDVNPAISPTRALQIARSAVEGIVLPPAAKGAEALVVLPVGRLAYLVEVATVQPHALEAIVDARTGEVLSLKDWAVFDTVPVAPDLADVFPTAAAAAAARQPDGSFTPGGTAQVTLDGFNSMHPGDHLTGLDLVTTNCCPTAGCASGASPKPLDGTLNVSGYNVAVHSVECDEEQIASADGAGDFFYQPATEPVNDSPPVPSASEADPFSEVMGYYFAENALDFVRGLDPQFQLDPNARPLHVKVNYLLPDLRQAYQEFRNDPQGVLQNGVTITRLMRFDNSMFVPASGPTGYDILTPGLTNAYDSLVFYQGTSADFAYDPGVVTHEFGHAVVAATAQFADYVADDQGVIDAPGALNEGTADEWAALRADDPHIGGYVGPLLSGIGEGSLRDLTNDFTCPTVIRGEVHQDSQHYSAAVWEIRSQIATTDADKHKFAQAFLAALRTMTPYSTFDDAANAIAAEVGTLFDPQAEATAKAVFDERKVVGCERVMDLLSTGAAEGYQLAGSDPARGWTPYAPGPVQFRLQIPAGTTSLTLTIQGSGGGIDGVSVPGLGGAPSLDALVRADARLHFQYGSAGVASDADQTVKFQPQSQSLVASVPVDGGCQGALDFLALGNLDSSTFQLDKMTVAYTTDSAKLAACRPDAGTPDAGTSTKRGAIPGSNTSGCGCTSPSEAALVALVGLAVLWRRRRQA